jgi:hypothetical protein
VAGREMIFKYNICIGQSKFNPLLPMKVLSLIMVPFFNLLSLGTGPQTLGTDCACHAEAVAALPGRPFMCDTRKCTVERKKVTYFFEVKSRGNNKYDVDIKAVVKGSANLVMSSVLTVTDKQSANGTVEVKVLQSVNEGYRWIPSGTSFVKGIYNTRNSSMSFEASGAMANLSDSNHGYTQAQLVQQLTPPKYDVGYVIKATVAYLILQYPNAMPLNS